MPWRSLTAGDASGGPWSNSAGTIAWLCGSTLRRLERRRRQQRHERASSLAAGLGSWRRGRGYLSGADVCRDGERGAILRRARRLRRHRRGKRPDDGPRRCSQTGHTKKPSDHGLGDLLRLACSCVKLTLVCHHAEFQQSAERRHHDFNHSPGGERRIIARENAAERGGSWKSLMPRRHR